MNGFDHRAEMNLYTAVDLWHVIQANDLIVAASAESDGSSAIIGLKILMAGILAG